MADFIRKAYWTCRDRCRRLHPRRLYFYTIKGILFDLWHGVETNSIVPVEEMGELGAGAAHARRYQATAVGFLTHVLTRLQLDPRRFTFVDFGSGKGRVLLMAARLGFRRILGVEFSPILHKHARTVIDTFSRKTGSGDNIEIRCLDAADLEIPDGPCVLYFYNPFDAEMMHKILDNIENADRKEQRPIIVVYCSPSAISIFEAAEFLHPMAADSYGIDDYSLFGNTAA